MYTPSAKALTTAMCLLLCLSANALGSRSMLQDTEAPPSVEEFIAKAKAECDVKSKAELFVIGSGSGTASFQASCSAFATALDDLENIVEDFFQQVEKDPEEECKVVEIERLAERCGQAVASAYVAVTGEITIEGNGRGCVSGFASADAFSRAFAGVIINIWVGITDGVSTADGDAVVGGLTAAISEAWAQAVTKACQKGEGFASTFESAFAMQVSEATVSALARVTLSLCSAAGVDAAEVQALADSFVEVDADTVSTSIVEATEGAFAGTGEGSEDPDVCKGKVNKECCKNLSNDVCVVKRVFYKQVLEGIFESQKTGERCFCNKLKEKKGL